VEPDETKSISAKLDEDSEREKISYIFLRGKAGTTEASDERWRQNLSHLEY
jgi:hypothetical protein